MINAGTQKLESERLILRKFKATDIINMYNNWTSDPEVTQMLTWPAHTDIEVTEMVLKRWLESYGKDSYYHWAIELKTLGQAIGSISLINIDDSNDSCEIGYCIGKSFWNQGITTEAFRTIISFAFNTLNINRITGRHHICNVSSGRVMQKCGLKYEGILREIIRDGRGKLMDCKCYSILKSDIMDEEILNKNK